MKSKPTKRQAVPGVCEASESSRRPSARSRAVSLLSRREHSQLELGHKLLQRGYSAEEVYDAVAWATSNKFQSDERFAVSLHRRRASTYGDRAIAAELSQHGLPAPSTDSIGKPPGAQHLAVSEELHSEESRAFNWMLKRHGPKLQDLLGGEGKPEPAEVLALKAKIFRALSSRGFEFGNIDRAWRRVISDITLDT